MNRVDVNKPTWGIPIGVNIVLPSQVPTRRQPLQHGRDELNVDSLGRDPRQREAGHHDNSQGTRSRSDHLH